MVELFASIFSVSLLVVAISTVIVSIRSNIVCVKIGLNLLVLLLFSVRFCCND